MRRRKIFTLLATALSVMLLAGLAGVNLAQADLIAYDVAAQTGNQSWTGSLGMDFDVNSAITVTELGVFDSGANGISGTLYAAIFSRDGTHPIVVPAVSFTAADPGSLIHGSRFKDIADVVLAPGQYSIVSWGYSSADQDGNTMQLLPPYPITISTLNSDGGAISFVGVSRYSAAGTGGTYPTTIDGGPVNRYLAGTFAFVPLPATALLLGSGLLGLGLLRFRKRA